VTEPADAYGEGLRSALPLIVPTLLIGASFGVAAQTAGWGMVAPVVMSAIVFAGSAQFAVLSVLGAGGGVLAAVAAGVLVNTRFLAMGAAFGPFMRGGALRRALEGQAVVDASLVLARTGAGRYGPRRLLGSTLPQYTSWTLGTLAGVIAGDRISDPQALGLDVLFPAFFVALLAGELTDRSTRVTALVAGVLALVLIPLTPPGVPIIAACLAVAAGRAA
jgi:4-azaleucine resistance transporter AzlC